jgi:hypothetical protein
MLDYQFLGCIQGTVPLPSLHAGPLFYGGVPYDLEGLGAGPLLPTVTITAAAIWVGQT